MERMQGRRAKKKAGNGGTVVTNKAHQTVETTKVEVDRVGGGFAGDEAGKGEVVKEKEGEAAKGVAKKGEDASRTGKNPAMEGTEKEMQGLPGGADRVSDTSKAAADKDKDTAKAIWGKGKDVKNQGADVAKNVVRNWDDNGGGKGEGEEEDGEGRKGDAEKEEEGGGEHGGAAEETLHSPERKEQVEEAAEAGEDEVKKGERGEKGCRNLEDGHEGGVEEGEKGANEGCEEGAQEEPDHSLFKDGKLNKRGNVVNEQGKVVRHIEEGLLKHLVGRRVDESSIIWNGCSNRIGDAEFIPDDEREEFFRKPALFESSPDATVDREGHVDFEDEYVGKGIEGDIKGLQGMKVDEDGEILDCRGNVVERAECWEPKIEAGPELEAQGDKSTLAGKRVNKAGDIVDSSGSIFDRGVEGDLRKRVSSMCDENRNNVSDWGDGICGAELDHGGEREGQNEGASAELPRCTVGKCGKVATPGGEAVRRLISGDSQKLKARPVEEDGDIADENGSILGHAERWEEGEVEKPKSPTSGRRVYKDGNVVDEDGESTVKHTWGELSLFAGKEADNNVDVIDRNSNTIGEVLLLSDIKEPDEFHDDKEKRQLSDKDKKLAQQIAYCLTQVLDKVKLICDLITRKIEAAHRTPKGLNEEQLVLVIRPLIEGGGKILTDGCGIIRGLDPDGRIQANANQKSAMLEASPEEYYLADLIKKITGTVTKTTKDAESKIEGMPQANTDLDSLWGQLNEPLFQIIAAVGLLLQGLLSLFGRLLSRTNVMDPVQG